MSWLSVTPFTAAAGVVVALQQTSMGANRKTPGNLALSTSWLGWPSICLASAVTSGRQAATTPSTGGRVTEQGWLHFLWDDGRAGLVGRGRMVTAPFVASAGMTVQRIIRWLWHRQVCRARKWRSLPQRCPLRVGSWPRLRPAPWTTAAGASIRSRSGQPKPPVGGGGGHDVFGIEKSEFLVYCLIIPSVRSESCGLHLPPSPGVTGEV